MFNLTRSRQANHVARPMSKHSLCQGSCCYWDGDQDNAYMIFGRYLYLNTDTEAGKDMLSMPILRLADGSWHDLSVVLDPSMETAGVSEPGANFSDEYSWMESLSALEELPMVGNQMEAAALVKERGPTAFLPAHDYASCRVERNHFGMCVDVTPFQEWLKTYVQKYSSARYEEIFNSPYHQHVDYHLNIDKDNGIAAFDRVAAKLGVSFVTCGDGVYDSNGFKFWELSPYTKCPLRAFAKLPPIRIREWERETFNGTDQD